MQRPNETRLDAPTILATLVGMFPAFESRWLGDENYFREEDGSFTSCGVFSAFCDFYCDGWTSFSTKQFVQLGRFVALCMRTPQSEADIAASTCFLEDIARDPAERPLAPHLSESGREFLRAFGGLSDA